MTPERWQQIDRLVETALEREESQRAAFLDEACAGDEELRQEVESLLTAHQQVGNFIVAPAFEAITIRQSPVFPVSNWDRYEFIKLLGEGGMGRVYLAKDLNLKRQVALKFLSLDNPELNQRFTREAQAQAKIEHEHICKVHEVGEVEGHKYIAMQYIDGLSLKDAMKQMSLEQKLKVMKQVAEALHAAHRLGLIHRDIKPANIMVEQSEEGIWRPCVMDFGLAKEMDVKGQTVTGMIMGTPAYMPPEQAKGKISQLDLRSDVYSLGATLYELLVGYPPFDGNSVMEILFKVVNEEPEPIRKLNSSLPLDLETIVMKCLEKEPERRYSTARALAEDLGRYLEGEPIEARPTSWIYRAKKRAKKQKTVVAVSAVALMVIMVLGGLFLYSRWVIAEQARLAYLFGQQMKEAETNLHSAYLLPLHDTKPERDKIRELNKSIESEMNGMGRVAVGPGHYAIGRGYLALREYKAARDHLDKAWQSGYRPPEVAYSLWQAMSGLYEKELEQATEIGNKELREVLIKEIEKEYLEPAQAYLNASGGLRMEAPEYREAVIAFYKREYDDALKKAGHAFEQVPSLYEAKKLQGDIYVAIGNDKTEKGDYEEALEDYERAGEQYRLTLEIARSDPAVYEAEISRWRYIIIMEFLLGHSPQRSVDQALSACDKALQADSESEVAYQFKSYSYFTLGLYQSRHGEDPRIMLEKAIEMAQQANRINQLYVDAYKRLGDAYIAQGEYEEEQGLDPRPSLSRAIESYQKAAQMNPNGLYVYKNLGLAYGLQHEYESGRGIDARQSLSHAIEFFQKSIQIHPNDPFAHNDLSFAYMDQGKYESGLGLDPRPSLSHSIESCQKAIQINPNFAGFYINLGNAYRIRASYEMEHGINPTDTFNQARTALDQALKLNSQSADVYESISELHRWQAEWLLKGKQQPIEDIKQGLKMAERALSINPKMAEAVAVQGALYLLQARMEQNSAKRVKAARRAQDTLEQALKMDSLLQHDYEPLLTETKKLTTH